MTNPQTFYDHDETEKDFLLPGRVYGSNFQNKKQSSCFKMPDGFVTPLRSTPAPTR